MHLRLRRRFKPRVIRYVDHEIDILPHKAGAQIGNRILKTNQRAETKIARVEYREILSFGKTIPNRRKPFHERENPTKGHILAKRYQMRLVVNLAQKTVGTNEDRPIESLRRFRIGGNINGTGEK